MRGVYTSLLAVALACATAVGRARAQQPLAVGVRADNDAFNFWLPPYARPDEEYTSGVRAWVTYAGSAWWDQWMRKGIQSCASGADRCSTRAYSFGQDIYTGVLAPGDTSLAPGTRPNAGWLYVQESSRVGSVDRLDETSITLGVTGPPALGGPAQRAFHSLDAAFNRPIYWATELPFEPGIVLAYDHTQRILAMGGADSFGGDVEPHAGASLGNILTEARAGVRLRGGFRVKHPWLATEEPAKPEVSLVADATVHGIVRNEFLAGTMFRPSQHVQERPFVAEYSAGITLRWKRLTLTYSADHSESEYVTRSSGHTWSRIGAEWRIAR